MINVEQILQNFLSTELEDDRKFSLYDYEAEKLVALIDNALDHANNVSINPYLSRIEHNPREKAFHELWLKWNKPQPGINHGQGTLQDLFIDPNPQTKGLTTIWHEQMNTRDRRIVATVIQWLGTNVGMSFLTEALKMGGQYEVKAVYNKSE